MTPPNRSRDATAAPAKIDLSARRTSSPGFQKEHNDMSHRRSMAQPIEQGSHRNNEITLEVHHVSWGDSGYRRASGRSVRLGALRDSDRKPGLQRHGLLHCQVLGSNSGHENS